MIKKDAHKLVTALGEEHAAIERILRAYLDEYADYGWDNICNELTNIAAQIDMIRIELEYAVVKGETE